MSNKLKTYDLNLFNTEPVPNVWAGNCFGCSLKNHDGFQLKVWPIKNGSISKITVPEKFCGFDGIVHGGIICALLDEISAWAILINLNRVAFTTQVTIKYIKPVPINKEIIVEALILSSDSDKATISASVNSLKGEVLAIADSEWKLPNMTMFSAITRIDEKILGTIVKNTMNPIIEYMKKK